MTDLDPHPFATLDPDFLLAAVESQGFVCDGRLYPLNSYENRVYQVGIEAEAPLIAKFYRPQRWTDAQILEEHAFCCELAEFELPVVTPLRIAGETLFEFGSFRFALFPRRGGQAPALDDRATLRTLGRTLGRIHAVGALRPFAHRSTLDSASHGHASAALIGERFIPPALKADYSALAAELLARVDTLLASTAPIALIRCHGDCHLGNVLWRDDAPHFVDFDDCCTAPAMQDLWMLLSGSRALQELQLDALLGGYREFHDFAPRELQLIEPLRALRMLHYAAWLARRAEDPAFARAFPWFNTARYWSEHLTALREQLFALEMPPLQLR